MWKCEIYFQPHDFHHKNLFQQMMNLFEACIHFLYRCKIPECDTNTGNREIEFDQPWLTHAIPSSKDSNFAKCVRYAPNDNVTNIDQNDCSANMFDSTRQIECNEFIYSSDEINVQTDVSEVAHIQCLDHFWCIFFVFSHFQFNIHCQDSYKLALIGTVNGIGRSVFLPFTGILADK